MKYKKYVMMFLAGTMALTPAAPMVALAEDAASVAESEATEGDASAEMIEESEATEGDASAETIEESEEKEEAEEEVEAEKSKEAAQTVEGIKNEEVEAQPILLEATETIPMAEENPDLAVGVYSVEYGIMNASNPTNPSMAGGVQDGNMIVEVSKDANDNKVYTYYMRVKEMAVGTIKAHMVKLKLGDENGESAETYATMTLNEETVPQVFRFARTEKEDQLKVTLVSSFMTAPAVIAIKWDTAESGATIPEQKAEENPELAVGVYSVEYGIMNASNPTNPSMAGGVQDGNMIVEVSKDANDNKVYTYYMRVKEMAVGTIKAHMVKLKLGDENGESAETYATMTLNEETVPQVFRFARTEKEDQLKVTLVSSFMTAPAVIAMKWDTATTKGAAIPEGDTKPEPPAATIPAPIITPAKTEAENGSTVAVTLAMDSQYQAAEIYYTTDGTAPTAASEKYTAPFKVTGSSETKTIKAIAVLDGKSSTVSEHSITFKKASNPGKTDEITDGKYWMDVQFYRADKDAVSMGDYALENNRRALVTVKNGTATIDVATNPIYRDGIVSGIGTIKCEDRDVKLEILEKNTLTTNAATFDYIESFRITLNDLTKKFVKVKFTVPNTPMEKLYPDGVPARLMLNFSGMTKANDSASLKPNSKTASKGGSSDEAFDAEDKETGVKLEAGKFVFNNGAELKAAKLTEAKDKETAEKLLKKQAEYIDLFEIKVMNGKTEATPSGTVKISIPVRKSETAVKLYRILPADKKKSASAAELEFTRSKDGKYLELEVKELGQFAVVYAEADEEAPMDDRTEAPVAKESRTDISGHWAESMIRNAMQKGIMTGVGNGDFAPNAAMTRGMLITALGRMEGVKAGMYEGGSFADVKQEDYFASFVAWAVAENIASGMSETVFAPNAEVTREQLAVFLYQYAQKKGIALTGESKTFTDAEGISDWAKDAVAALTGAGLLNGRPDGSFNAKGKATRAEVATVLVKLAEMTAEK